MTSQALDRWHGERSARLDELVAAHQTIGGVGPGRRWPTQQLNYSLHARLAAEFQGFCRELHDFGAEWFARTAGGNNAALEAVLRTRATEGRQLDRGNAQAASLGSDFGRFGFQLWPALGGRDPTAALQQARLEALNTERNGIAHDDEAKLAALRADGYPVTLATFRRMRASLNRLARNLDAEVAARLGALFGVPPPW